MKKILLSVVASALMATSSIAASWETGTVGYIQFTDTLAKVELITASGSVVKNIDPAGTFFKEMVASLLTAKAQGTNVALYGDVAGWTKIKLN